MGRRRDSGVAPFQRYSSAFPGPRPQCLEIPPYELAGDVEALLATQPPDCVRLGDGVRSQLAQEGLRLETP